MREIEFKITSEYQGRQIREFLRDFGVSSSLLSKLKRTENGITVNAKFARAVDILNENDILKIVIADSGSMPSPAKMDIEICYEDEDIIVLNKPPFLPVHESRNHIGDTLSNFVAYHLGKEGEHTAFRAVFRLDRDTSGLVMVAKNELAAAKLAGRVKKDYYAVAGKVFEKGGVIDAPIARCGDSIIKRRVDPSGERAVTHFEPVSIKDGATLLKINLETGRTHQIRVHLAHIGAPLLGDSLYGGDCSEINRQALHCKTIYFTHPITGKEMVINCPFSDDFKEVI